MCNVWTISYLLFQPYPNLFTLTSGIRLVFSLEIHLELLEIMSIKHSAIITKVIQLVKRQMTIARKRLIGLLP